MKTIALLLLIVVSAQAQMITQNFGTGANSFTIDFVSIGNPSNSADTTGYGSVGYTYNIGAYETSVNQINSAIANGLAGVRADSQNWNTTGDGPAFGISWLQAAAFVNWLGTSKGYQAAYKLTYVGGPMNLGRTYSMQLWQPGEAGYDPTNPFRNSLATYFLPSENEWYKAAYFDPNKNGGLGGYWLYATGSDSAPTPVSSGTIAGTSIYGLPADGQLSYASSVYQAGGASPYGTVGQGGNVWEMLESGGSGTNTDPEALRAERGGSWTSTASQLSSAFRIDELQVDMTDGYGNAGFRVAMIPEPSTLSLLFAGGALLIGKTKNRKNRR